ncbi:MAG TPA: hypothetical protein VN030_14405 [Cellvibrio sp.]|nr:hypothetical protein [Cellvibrio sp.]
MRALILGARAPACLEWARALTAENWQVTLADSLRWPLSKFSAVGRDYCQLPEPRKNPQRWIAALQQLVQQKNIDWIIPTCEEVFYLAWGAEQLKPYCQIFCSNFALLQQLHHKGRFAELTKHWPVHAPETHLIENHSQLKLFYSRCQQLVFKPAFSRFATNTLIRPAPAQLDNIQPSAEAPWVAQQFIAGKEHCSFSIIRAGKLVSHACYHPRYRVGKGSGIYFEVTRPAAIQTFVEQFAEQTHYTGQVAFDFMEDAEGRMFVLECNPRATSGVHLFNDNPAALSNGFSESNNAIAYPSAHPRMLALAMLLFAAGKHFYRKSFWQDYSCAQDILVREGDAIPYYAQLFGLGEISARVIKHRTGLLAAATADIEWDGQSMELLMQGQNNGCKKLTSP